MDVVLLVLFKKQDEPPLSRIIGNSWLGTNGTIQVAPSSRTCRDKPLPATKAGAIDVNWEFAENRAVWKEELQRQCEEMCEDVKQRSRRWRKRASQWTRRLHRDGDDKTASTGTFFQFARCFQDRSVELEDAPRSWKIVKMVFLRKPDAEPNKVIRSHMATALTSVTSK